MKMGISAPHAPVSQKDEWLTPPDLIRVLGRFDLDPCAPINRPWNTATLHYTILDDGLKKDWGDRRVFCNPPYSNVDAWLEKCWINGNCEALIYARTDTATWVKYVWERADAIMFLYGRLFFYHVDGTKAKHNCGAPSAIIAYGDNNVEALYASGLKGKVVRL